MPIIKSAIKKLRRDNKRKLENRAVRVTVRKSIKDARISSSNEDVSKAFSLIDKAVKKGLIKKNTAARKKSQLSKTLTNTPTAAPTKTVKTAAKKPAIKKSAKK